MAKSEDDKLAEVQKELEILIMDKYGEDSENPVAHIFLLGQCGHGKSALVNTLVKAILGTFIQVADYGAGTTPTKTLDLRHMKNLGIEPYMMKKAKRSKDEASGPWHYSGDEFFSLLPHVTDFAGFSNQQQLEFGEILQLLILGYIPLGTTIQHILTEQKKVGIGNLKSIFNVAKPQWRVTHILFVQSCRTAASVEIAKCLSTALRETQKSTGKLTYSGKVHVMLTKYDKVNKNALTGDNLETGEYANTDEDGTQATLRNIQKDLAEAFDHEGNVKHSQTTWISCCDEVGYDNKQLDIRAIQFLTDLLTHRDPPQSPGTESGQRDSDCVAVDRDAPAKNSSWCTIS